MTCQLKMFLLTIITKIFHFLPEEIAHRFALSGLRIVYASGLLKVLLGKKFQDSETLDNSLDKKGYKNKLGIAAGLDKDGEYIDCLSALGIGFIEVGTVTPFQQYGNPKPRLFRNKADKSLLNRLELFSLKNQFKQGKPLLLHDEPIFKNDKIVGYTTSSNYSFCYKKNICLAYIKNEVKDNDRLFIEVEGRKYALNLEKQPIHDPRSILMRS